jgi:hypothetical protein
VHTPALAANLIFVLKSPTRIAEDPQNRVASAPIISYNVRRNNFTDPANISPANNARKNISGITTLTAAPLSNNTLNPCTASVVSQRFGTID